MSLAISLFLDEPRAVVGEHPSARMQFTNLGDAPITIPDPERSRAWPKVIARDALGTQTVTHRTDIEALTSHEYRVPLPERFVTLAPHEQVAFRVDLAAWVPPLAPGDHDLALWLVWEGGQCLSPVVRLTVTPAALRVTAAVYAHSGVSPNVYVATVDVDGALALHLFTPDPAGHGHLRSTTSVRIARCDPSTRPMLSVTANDLPYPAHWIALYDGAALYCMFERQGRVEVPPHALPWPAADARFATPILHDLEGNDGSAPGRALLAWWRESDARSLSLDLLDASGALHHRADVSLPAPLAAAHGWIDCAGAPAWLCVTHDDWSLGLSRATEADGAAPLGALHGRLVESAVALGPDDTLHGAAVLLLAMERGVPSWGMQAFSRAADGAFALRDPQPIAFADPRAMVIDALVALSAEGDALALLRTSDGAWWVHPGHDGHPAPLAEEAPGVTAPEALVWALGSFHVVTVAAERGVVLRALHAEH